MSERRYNVLMTLFGAGGGAAGHFAGMALAGLSLPRPVSAALYMAAVGLFALAAAVLAETVIPAVNGVNWKRDYKYITWKYLFPAAVLPLALTGAVFQFAYQLDFIGQKDRDVYILIDRSGSMEWNDPGDERLNAVARLLERFDERDRVEIIIFDHEAEILKPLAQVAAYMSGGVIDAGLSEVKPRGGTDFNYALSLTYQRIDERREKNREAAVILLSDGEAEISEDILALYIDGGISINAVGMRLEQKDGEAVLSYIAKQTGGLFVLTDDASELHGAFVSIYQPNERFILNRDAAVRVNLLQWLMFTAAGLLIGLAAAFIFDNRYLTRPLAAGGALGGLLAGGLMSLFAGALIPCVLLGSVYTLFTLFAKRAR